MIRISSPLVIPLTIAMILFSIPVTYHSLTKPMVITCKNPEATLEENFMPDVIKLKPATSELHGFIDGTIGTLTLPGAWDVPPRFRTTRTYDLYRYYFVPMDNFTNLFPEDRVESVSHDVDGVEVPLHLRIDESEGMAVMTVYFFVIGGRPVRNPFWGSLSEAIPQLRLGSIPLTMILVNAMTNLKDAETARATLIDWAGRAWTAYDQTCGR
jgi:hypothetical protein